MKKVFILILIAFGCWKLYNYSDSVTLGPGVMVAEAPRQVTISRPTSFNFDDYTLTEVAKFDLRAKVLSRKNYRYDREADLSSTDLALGWGRMSDESILEKIKISQSGRFYYWRVDAFPIPRGEIETHSANMHLIPANDSVKSSINKVRRGDIVKISGSLVNVSSAQGNWHWKSSQTRNDTGSGACEVIFVRKLDIVTP